MIASFLAGVHPLPVTINKWESQPPTCRLPAQRQTLRHWIPDSRQLLTRCGCIRTTMGALDSADFCCLLSALRPRASFPWINGAHGVDTDFQVISWSEAHSAPASLLHVQSNQLFSFSSKAGHSVPCRSDTLVNDGEQLSSSATKDPPKREVMFLSGRSRITTTLPYVNHREQITFNYPGRTVKFTASPLKCKWVQMRSLRALNENPNPPSQILANVEPWKAFRDHRRWFVLRS